MLPHTPALKTHTGNNFNAIRIAAATLVLYSHHYALTGLKEPSFFGIYSLGGLAVAIFFTISGYLVTASWQRDPSMWRFALRRFLRIWPALTATIILTIYGLGTWVTELPLQEYLTHPITLNYLRGLWLENHLWLPGVFEHNPIARAVNGSLWTIPLEVRCYIVLGLAGLVGLLKQRPIFLFCIVLFMMWLFATSNADQTGFAHYGREFSAFFLSGAALHALEPHWSRRPALWAVVIGTACAMVWAIGWRHTALLIGLPFAVIYAGTQSTPFIRRAGRWGDPSYGIYLFAFPVQQTVILHTWPALGFAGTLVAALMVSVALAYGSWHLVEKQAMRLKPRHEPCTSSSGSLFNTLSGLSLAWIWPLLASLVGLRFIMKRLDSPVMVDPAYAYLPAARALLEQGWSFLLTPESYRVVPLAYLWPALWGADPTLIRIAHMGLWVGCVWFLWRICVLLGGHRAGMVAMLLALHPELVRYFPSELTEPIYLFGLFGWMHAMARIIISQEHSIAVAMQGAFMLTITLLSRPVLQLIAPAALLVCLGCIAYWSIAKKGTQPPGLQLRLPTIAWSLGWGLVLPITLVVKNGVVFGLWGLGTGSGIGLYLGTHPLFQGAEPGFLGFNFDVNWLAGLAGADHSHSLIADRATRQAALWQLQSMPMADALAFFSRKLWWWLAHHPAQIEAFGSALRKVRLLELLLVVVPIAWLAYGWIRRINFTRALCHIAAPVQWAFAAFLLAMFLAMLAQMMPILYNSRYSSALLDPWLIPLASFGFAILTAPIQLKNIPRRDSWSKKQISCYGNHIWPSIAAMIAIITLVFGGYGFLRKYENIAIDPMHMGLTLAHLTISDSSRIETQGMVPYRDRSWVITESPAVLQVHIDQSDVDHLTAANLFNALWETEIALQSQGKFCGKAEIAYQMADGRILQPLQKLSLMLSLQADGTPHRLVTHANHELRPHEPGSLRIMLDCPAGTVVEWRSTRLLESRHALDAASHILPQPTPP